jgi:S-adenosylmethionine decarboxylase proenzyme
LEALGRQILIEFYGCEETTLKDTELIRLYMNEAAVIAGATIVGEMFHSFNPAGVSGVVVIAESHLAIHTWPEYRYAAVDLFTCGTEVDPWKGFEVLKERLAASTYSATEMRRGLFNLPPGQLRIKPDAPPLQAPCEALA